MLMIIRLWLVVLVLAVLSWLLLRFIDKPQALRKLVLFWVVAVFGSMGMMYVLSVWVAGL
ncbi:hypothetical protein THMIRHAS_18520 [Thiosulfatimonas sediminis]|uniref:Uncharacterized protein n=1 Tax=Thiosulfatimonas sediminis TaxID=2675054 RepID=A0A6F8PWI4_9GAMM|nr:hypothetical protein [Thiosulfatimonas sediminis]BBP46479.1 hypothetical protein THMIRHAS_18520 [Thiosulfatimonas sediminis]